MAITVKHNKVSTIPDGDDSSLIRPSDWNDDHVLTGTVPVANGGTGASTLTGYVKGNGTSAMTASASIPSTDITGLGTMSIQNANNVNITGGSISGTTVSGYIPTSAEGQPNGVATLDSGGQIPLSQIPPLGDLNYQGAWNANTNTPTLTSSVGTKGYYYVVSVAGTTNLNGITDWQVGDWAVYSGTAWQKIDNTDSVTSVNGYTGTVVLTQPDIAGTVPTSRTISTGTGLTGGGDLSANRTISFSTASVGTWAATPSSANLAAAMTDETGSGSLVFGTSPTISSPTISGGSINGANIGGSVAGDGSFDVLTANVSRLGNASGNYFEATNGLVSTGTFTDTPPSDGIVIDYATGFGRFSDFGGDGFQWYNAGVATTKLMELASSGALNVLGNVTANGTVLTGNTGTVTSISAGTGLSGGTITTSGTIALANTTVSAGSYTYASITVDAQGRLTSASSGTSPVTSVGATSPIASSGGTTPTISISQASTSTNGYLSSTDWNTFNNKQPAGTYVTSVSGTSGRITSSGGTTPAIDLASGIATPGTTGSSSLIPVITIDTYGRVTSITTASNPQGTVTSVSGTGTVSGITLSGTVTSSGNLTLGGTLDLSSPPAIGGTTPAAITGTTITATKYVGVSGGTF